MQKHGPRQLRNKRRRGTSTIEMALILPILVLLVVACIDFGRFGYWFVSVSNAAREGAWYATAFPSTGDVDVWKASVAEACAEEMGVDAAAMPADWVSTQLIGSDRVQVTVQYPFRMLVNWPAFADEYTISQRVEMRVID